MSYDQVMRTQLVGTPVRGVAVPGTMKFSMLARTGWVAGAGVEFGFASNWTARLEYLFTDYGSHQECFAQGAQVFDADLTVHEMRLGLNYRFGSEAAGFSSTPETANWAIHGQTTFVAQAYPSFRSLPLACRLILRSACVGILTGHQSPFAACLGFGPQRQRVYTKKDTCPWLAVMALANSGTLGAPRSIDASWAGSMPLTSVIFRPMASDVNGSRHSQPAHWTQFLVMTPSA